MNLPTSFVCPVCGFACLTEPPYWPGTQDPSFEICPSCTFQFGYDDLDQGFTYEQWRQQWIADGMPWRNRSRPAPPGWDPVAQLGNVQP